jgi:hypothetical protein
MVAISEKGECAQRGNVWGGGNILLGGAGSDTITGRGANDIIDGDRYVSVRLSVRTNPNNPNSEIGSASVEGTGQSAMSSQYLRDSSGKLTGPTLQQAVFNGTLDPGNIVVVREILSANNPGDKDTAVYEDTRDSYMCTDLSGATPVVMAQCPREWSGGKLEVSHLSGGGGIEDGVGEDGALLVDDGTDIVSNVEELVFSDSIPPAPPTGVTAEGRNKSALVEWLPSASPVTSYQVQVLNSAGTQVGALRDLLEPPDIGLGLQVNGLINQQTYTFKVRGVNEFGPGDWSAPSNAVTPHAALPDAPTRPRATAGDRHVKLSWTPPFGGGALITGYEIQVSDASGPIGGPRATTDTTLKVTGLANGREYFFQVRALNEEGPGAWSPEVAAVPLARPGLPTIKRLEPRDRSVMVHWTAPADDGGSPITVYRIQVLTLSGQQVGRIRTADAPATRLLVKHLDNGRTYRLRMKAKNAAGGSAWTDPVTFKPRR